jgi:hypothetical protein
MKMEEKPDSRTTTGNPETDGGVQAEQLLQKQVMDLRRELELERAKTAAPRSTLDLIGSISWDKPKAFLAFFAVVLFGAVRFADAAFFARLGLAPEDVGLSSAVIIARSTMSVVLLGASLILLGFWMFAIERRAKWWWPLLGTPMACVGLILFRSLFPLPRFVLTDRDLWIYNGSILVGGAILGWRVARHDHVLQRGRGFANEAGSSSPERTIDSQAPDTSKPATDATSARTRVIIVELAFAVIILFGLAGILGYSSAAQVMDNQLLRCGCTSIAGREVSFPWMGGAVGFLAVRVQHAEVAWNTNTPPKTPPDWLVSLPMDVMYLGQADGMIVVYDPVDDRPLRFPVGAVLVRVEPRLATTEL